VSGATDEEPSARAAAPWPNGPARDEKGPGTDTGPGTDSRGREQDSFDAEERNGDDPELAGDRGLDDRIVAQTVQAKNSFSGSYVRIEGDFISGGDERRLAVSPIDITHRMKDASAVFVEPGYFAELQAALTKPNVLLLTGGPCGKRTAAGVALQRANCDPILQMPSGVSVGSLVDAIERASKRSRKAGILIESVDAKTLRMLAGFEMQRLHEVLRNGTAVVLTAQSAEGAPRDVDGVVAFACSTPDPKTIVERSGASASAQRTAIAALELLQGHAPAPSDVEALLEQASSSEASAEQLARAFDGQATDVALEQWLGAERDAADVAALVAATALDGVPIVDVDRASQTLHDGFVGDQQDEVKRGIKTFKSVDRGWPSDMVEVAYRTRGTYFGRHATEVASVCPPHTRARIFSYLWRRLGPDFRVPFINWLRALADDSDIGVRHGAAMSAGVLFTINPVVAERELIKPWALGERFSLRLCAAIALGAPVAIGADAVGARGLVRRWCDSSDKRLRHAAVLAYGGLLGAWDPESAAAMHLWQIGADTPELTRSSNISLASLTAAGDSAVRSRATVIGLLSVQVENERVPRRVYALLPLILKQLTAPNDAARASFLALVEDERESFDGFAKLFARALTEPVGHESARAALGQLLYAVASGRVERQIAAATLKGVRGAASAVGELEAVDAQLERVLWTAIRTGGSAANAAKPMLTEFFPSS
jgi:hypothetical protein